MLGNAKNVDDLRGVSAKVSVAGGADIKAAGLTCSLAVNSKGENIWQVSPGWTPGQRTLAPFSFSAEGAFPGLLRAGCD
jgi:hypothetical protein